MRKGTARGGCGFKKNVLVMYITIGSSNIFNKNGSGIVVKIVKCKHKISGWVRFKLFFLDDGEIKGGFEE